MIKRDHLAPLTSVRFFAAMWVIVFHESGPKGLLRGLLGASPAFVFNLARTGYAAVGLFFVLSGFILAYNYGSESLSRREFWWARFARVYPTYLLALLIVAPPILAKLAMHMLPQKELVYGAASAVLIQAWHPAAALSWNTPGWSLSDEAFFYLLFPLLLIPIRSWSNGRLLVGMAVTWLLLLGVPAFCWWKFGSTFRNMSAVDLPVGDSWNIVKFNPLIRLPEFVFGVLLGRLFVTRGPGRGVGWMLYVPGTIVFVCCAALLAPHMSYLFFHNNALIVCYALLIYGLACGGGPLDRVLSWSPFVRLGQVSYAMYILHVPVNDWMMRIDKQTLHLETNHPVFLFAVYVAAVLSVSFAACRWVDEPARRYLRKWFTAVRPQRVPEVVGALA